MRRIAPDHVDAARAVPVRPPPEAQASKTTQALCAASAAVAPVVVRVLERLISERSTADQSHIAHVVRAALATVPELHTLHVHPEEYTLARRAAPAHLTVHGDPALAAGGLLAHGTRVEVDARVQTQILCAVQRCLEEFDS